MSLIKEAETIGVEAYDPLDHGGNFRGVYLDKACFRPIFVIVYVWEKSEENTSFLAETLICIPLEWISRSWKFCALPNDAFYYPGEEFTTAVSTNPKYKQLVDRTFKEYLVSRFPKRMGCKFDYKSSMYSIV
jgi:hypothetical protein